MSLIIFLVLGVLGPITEGTSTTCSIENVNTQWLTTHNLGNAINDTYRGVLAVFNITNIQRVREKNNRYFNVTWDSHTLTLATGDNFDKYETENEYTSLPSISVDLHFECTKDSTKDMTFVQNINDTNNHAPKLSQTKYEYALGPSIPKGFILTDLLRIKAVDVDISNRQLNFQIPQNPYFKIDKAVFEDGSKQYSTKLVALQEIPAPFYQEFELNVTDSGVPPRQTRGSITVTVLKPEKLVTENTTDVHHPPVFGKNFYLAYYTNAHEIEMEDVVTIRYGLTNATIVKLTNYNDYFYVKFRNETITLNVIKELPQDILATGFIVVELEAVNEGLNSSGRTALLIEFSDSMLSSGCEIFIFGYSVGYPTVLLTSAILTIILINICVLGVFFNKQKMSVSNKC
ncbi:hypothetical protein RI129_008502 [Pyrocoelia pectoralis]|uniref:Cadherin domain-containing protein n=1 Tax=Pyrocoelia pectoralis TaxID=417401 RepID=A0AAN7ZDR3_9COLE